MRAQQKPWQPSSPHLRGGLSLRISRPVAARVPEQEACSEGPKEAWLRGKCYGWQHVLSGYRVIIL